MVLKFFVLAISCFIFVICLIVFEKWGKAKDANVRMIKSVLTSDDVIEIDHSEMEETFFTRYIKPLIDKFQESMGAYNKKKLDKNNQVVDEKKLAKIQSTEKLLRMSGTHTSYKNYQFFKMAFSIIFITLTLGIAVLLTMETMYVVIIIAAGIVFALFIPDFFLKAMVSSHQAQMRSQLPDVLDLLSVCTGAGLSFDNALERVIDKMEGPLIDEFMTVFRQMQMGIPRNEALKSLADCTDIDELKTFISAVVQANQLGISVTNVMAVQSKQLRQTRRENAREKSAKAATMLAIPIMFFIFPALFIVILGPTVMSVMDATGSGG